MRVVKHLLCVWQWSGSHLGWFYSLNKRTTLLFAPWEIWYQYLDSTAYEGCKTFMCLTMIWMKPSWMGLQPQLPHYTVVSVAPREIPWIRQHPKACLKRLARTQKGLIHLHIHSIWRLWNTFIHVFYNEVWSNLGWVYSLNISAALLEANVSSNMIRTHPYAHPNYMKVVKHKTLKMCFTVVMWKLSWPGL